MTRGRLPLWTWAVLVGVGAPGIARAGPASVATVQVDCPAVDGLTAPGRRALERHLRSSGDWAVLVERRGRFAVRTRPPGPEYQHGLYGGHSHFGAPTVLQTRVVIGLEQVQTRSARSLTRATARAGPVEVRSARDGDQPGQDSHLVVSGGGITVEVFEQSRGAQRPFTVRALKEVCREVGEATKAARALAAQGHAPGLTPAGSIRRGAPSIEITDGMQPGIYGVDAWVHPSTAGPVWVRVFFVGPGQDPAKVPPELKGQAGVELSADRIRPRTTQYIGHGPDPKVQFRYQAGLTVYEGDWALAYRARFEVWHQATSGAPERLATVEREISGWQR